jgi:hypothetical protein
MERSGKKVAGLQNLYGQMMRRFGDEDQAFSAAMAIGTNKAASKLRTLAAARGDEESKIRAEEMLAKLAEQEQQWLMAVYKPRPMGGGSATKKMTELDKMLLQHKLKLDESAFEHRLKGGEVNKEDRKDVRELSKAIVDANLPKFQSSLSEAETAFEKAGGAGMNPLSQFIYRNAPGGTLAFRAIHGEDAFNRQKAMQALVNSYYKEVGGAAVNAAEDARYQAALTAGDYKGAMESLRSMREQAAATEDAIKAGFEQPVVDTYDSRRTGRVPSARKDK